MHIIKNLKKNFEILFLAKNFNKTFFYIFILYNILRGFSLAVANVLLIKILFQKIENNEPFQDILMFIAFYTIYQIIIHIFYSWFWEYYTPYSYEKIQKNLQLEMYTKLREVELEKYDNSEFYESIILATKGANEKIQSIFEDFGWFIYNITSLITIAGVLFSIDVLVGVLLCISLVISIIVQNKISKLLEDRANSIKPFEHRISYIKRIFYLKDYAETLKLSQGSKLFQKKYFETIDKVHSVNKSYGNSILAWSAFGKIFNILICELFVMCLLGYKLFITNTITMGGFAASINAIWRLNDDIRGVLSYSEKVSENIVFIDKYLELVNYKAPKNVNSIAMPQDYLFEEINVNNVTFKYEKSEKNVIEDISLSIRRGEKIAIVGYNGAGKSTFIKLLLNFYDVQKGSITIDGKKINQIPKEIYNKLFSTVFQDFQIYAATIAENVAMDVYCDDKEKEIIDALKKAQIYKKVKSYDNDIYSILTKEFNEDGIVFSGGQKQRLALARVFFENKDIILLDEPTSALDPVAEYEINEEIMTNFKYKTIIFISHRLYSTKNVDKIFMFDNGKIIESGTHKELMQLNGKYAHMFNLQSKKYIAQ